MADDAAAPDGELTEATSERKPKAEQAESGAAEPDQAADEDVDEVEDDDAEDSVE